MLWVRSFGMIWLAPGDGKMSDPGDEVSHSGSNSGSGSMIQDHSGSWCVKGAVESVTRLQESPSKISNLLIIELFY